MNSIPETHEVQQMAEDNTQIESPAEAPATGCLLCGADLVYRNGLATLPCALCGEPFSSPAACANGHYVCDRCHSLGAMDLIQQFCSATDAADPVEMALQLMRHPAVKMHGPEHHYLVPAVLIAAWCNRHDDREKSAKLRTARQRAEEVKGGFCGFHGTCGAAMGAGIACSVITGATPLTQDSWRLANLMTAACLTAIAAPGGPRCCKRDTFLALDTALTFLNEHLDAGLPVPDTIRCDFTRHNRECIGSRCPYFPD